MPDRVPTLATPLILLAEDCATLIADAPATDLALGLVASSGRLAEDFRAARDGGGPGERREAMLTDVGVCCAYIAVTARKLELIAEVDAAPFSDDPEALIDAVSGVASEAAKVLSQTTVLADEPDQGRAAMIRQDMAETLALCRVYLAACATFLGHSLKHAEGLALTRLSNRREEAAARPAV